jgi:glycerophosphoryl diester phosphodiesterase
LGEIGSDKKWKTPPMKPLKFEKPLIMAHRGFQTDYPENTMVSFMAAVETGAQFVELDVTLTHDHQVAVIHDDTVDRTTNGIGPVHNFNLKELQKLDAGSWFHSRFAGERIPALIDVLGQVTRKAYINLEIKSYDHTSRQLQDEIEPAVVALIDKTKTHERVLISSFDPVVLKNVQRLNASLQVAFISKLFNNKETVRLCKELDVFSYHPNLAYLNAEQVNVLHKADIRVFPYNINDKKDIYRGFALGADGLIAKNPHLARQCYNRTHQRA